MARLTKQPKTNVVFKFKPFSKQQKRVFKWWTLRSPYKEYDGIIADGSIRSGKTVSMALSYVIWAMCNFNEQNFGMSGKTVGSFRRNVLVDLKKMLLSRGYKFYDKRADNLFIVSRGNVTNYFYIFGGRDERSQDLIQGITLAGMLFDEVALMPESFVNQATGRLSISGSKMWFNCNPDNPYHYFKTNWVDKAEEKNLLYLHFTMDDNLSLDDKIKDRYKNMYFGVFYKRFIQGLWTSGEGAVYSQFDRDTHVIDYDQIPHHRITKYICGVDWGYKHKGVIVVFGIDEKERWYLIEEHVHKKKHIDDWVEIAKEIAQRYGDNIPFYCDSARPEYVDAFYFEGLNAYNADKSKIPGIAEMGKLIKTDSFYVCDRCINFLEEIYKYIWAPRGDEPIKEFDDVMDACRYAIYTYITLPDKLFS